MARVKFSRKEFEKHIKLTKEIEEKINLFGTHVENLAEEIELEILPNRPDLFSLPAFIKSFSAFLGKEKGLREYKTNKPEKNYEVKIDSSVSSIRPFTACAIVREMKFNDEKIKEIIDIQEKIHSTFGRNRRKIAIGIYPLEKITLPIKFEARKPKDIKFIPLEFDRELNGLQILQQHLVGRDYAHLLEGKEKFPVFVDGAGEILSMPPVINSEKTGKITDSTRDIFIECSGFDLNALKKTLNILVTMLADMGGEIYEMQLFYGKNKILTPDLTPEKMKLNIDTANKLLGLNLKESEIKNCLERMGFNYNKGIAEVPAWRTDIMHEVDLIEDIAIAFGYENFKPEIPPISTVGEVDKTEALKKKIADILIGLDMLEISSYHLLTEEDIKNLSIKAVETEDSKSEYKLLRPNLMVSVLKTLGSNIDAEYPHRIFELGRVFEQEGKEETGIKETERLCIAISSADTGFTEIKQTVEYILRMMGKTYSIDACDNANFVEGRCISIHSGKEIIGIAGEMHPKILSKLRIEMPVVLAEIAIEKIA